jgi:hypothetical protein
MFMLMERRAGEKRSGLGGERGDRYGQGENERAPPRTARPEEIYDSTLPC